MTMPQTQQEEQPRIKRDGTTVMVELATEQDARELVELLHEFAEPKEVGDGSTHLQGR
jgi:hypothetical protein